MASNELDDISRLPYEIALLKRKIARLDKELSDISMERKMLMHALSDSEYKLRISRQN